MGNLFQKIVTKDFFKSDDVQQKQFLEDLGHLIIKKQLANPICGKCLA